MSERKILREVYVVARDYTQERSPIEGSCVGTVACADFRKFGDAREYFLWQQKRWRADEKKFPGQTFEWKLYRRTDYYPGEHPSGCDWTLLEG